MNSNPETPGFAIGGRRCLFALALMLAITFGGRPDVVAGARTEKVDLELLLLGETQITPVCCCTLKGVALERRLEGARQDGLDFLPKGDVYEIFLRLAPRSFASLGYSTHHADGSMSVAGPNGHGSLLLSPVDDATWSWVAYTDGVESGRGQLTN